jgi:hypothetical protein
MASVQMSQTLRDQITENYKKQLYSAYRQTHDVQPAIDTITQGIMDNDPEFTALCKLQEDYKDVIGMVKTRYSDGRSYYGNDKVSDYIVNPSTTLGLICNPDRPILEHGTYITEWHMAYKDEYSSDLGKMKKPSDNFLEGDIPVQLTDLHPYYAPTKLSIEYHRGWHKQHYAPHVDGTAIIVSDPVLCAHLAPIGEIEIKVGKDVATFEEYIAKITTLKRFIDEWPGGKGLVPDEYLQRMLTKKVPSQANRMTPDQVIPDELKEQMNEVLLTNKLMGDD